MEEHLNNEKTSKFVGFEIGFFFTCTLILPILLAIYYNIGKSTGGAIAMAFSGSFLDFVALMIASVLIDDKYNHQGIVRCAIKNFVVDLLFSVLLCCIIVIAKHFAIKTGMVVVGMISVGVVIMVAGVCLIGPEQGSERG